MTDYFALFALRILIWLLEVLPKKVGFWLAKIYVRVLLLAIPRLKKVALRNLEIAFPEKTVQERILIYKKSLNVLGKNLLGYALIPKLNLEKAASLCDYSKANTLIKSLHDRNPGVGILIATAHFDQFENLVQVHALLSGKVSILARGFGLKHTDRWWNKRREMFGNTVFWRSGGYQEIVRRLKRGEDVTILCDQNVKANHAVFADFFNLPAATSKTIALAALRTKAPVIFGCAFETSSGKFEISISELSHPDTFPGSKEEKVKAFTTILNKEIENHIRKKPEAWFWIHRRWKTRPPGEAETLYS